MLCTKIITNTAKLTYQYTVGPIVSEVAPISQMNKSTNQYASPSNRILKRFTIEDSVDNLLIYDDYMNTFTTTQIHNSCLCFPCDFMYQIYSVYQTLSSTSYNLYTNYHWNILQVPITLNTYIDYLCGHCGYLHHTTCTENIFLEMIIPKTIDYTTLTNIDLLSSSPYVYNISCHHIELSTLFTFNLDYKKVNHLRFV